MPRKGKKRREAARVRREAEHPPDEARAGAPAAVKQRVDRARPAKPRPPRERRRKQAPFPAAPVAAVAGVAVIVMLIATGAYLLLSGGSSSGAGESEKDPFVGKTADVSFTIEANGEAEESRFAPDSVTIKAGQTVELVMKNVAKTASHNIHLVGPDKEYDTLDDCLTCGKNRLVSFPQAVEPGKTGYIIARVDQPGTYAFRCDFHLQYQFGTLLVQ